MLKKIEQTMKMAGIYEYGFCRLEQIKQRLPYYGKEDIPINGTIIVVLFPYFVEDKSPKNISRYAAVPDYHKICGEKLKQAVEELKKIWTDHIFLPFIDHSPLPEVYAAMLAGLGVIGKNGLLLTKKYGSYVFIGEIVTDLEITLQENNQENKSTCIYCGKCEKACPTGSITAGEKTSCYSKITQQKQPLSVKQTKLLKKVGCIWGCDICQECCPYNKYVQKTNIKEFLDEYRTEYIQGETIENRAYAWRGRAVIERNAELVNQPENLKITND